MTIPNLTYEEFIRIIDNLYDEVFVYDNNYKIVYVNKACERHYGFSKDEMIGRSFFDFEGQYWNKSILPYVYQYKKAVLQRQKTYMGTEILTISIPIFNSENEIEFVVMSVRDDLPDKHPEFIDAEFIVGKDEIEEIDKNNTTIIYKSETMSRVMDLVNQIKDVSAPSIISGETGSGKSLIGKHIFKNTTKYNRNFVHLNCGAIHSDLIETELFGYEKGTFTGALKEGKKGLIEAADGGILFLDEISELPYNAQSKLLQFLEEKEYYQVGGIEPIKVDLKIITATNRNLKKMVEVNEFREDLYFRLNVFEIEIPPLRERKEDIQVLTNFFLNKFNSEYGKASKIDRDAMEILCNYSWKGNVRELSHVIERLVVIAEDLVIRPNHLPKNLYDYSDTSYPSSDNLDDAMMSLERKMIIDAYSKVKTTRKVAEKLGISQSKATRLIKKYVNND